MPHHHALERGRNHSVRATLSAPSRSNTDLPELVSPIGASSVVRAHPISVTPEISDLLAQGAAAAIGISGGKGSQAAAMATFEHLDRIGHAGPRLLIHADLGSVEWADSLPTCQQLSEHLGVDLVTVRRKQGGLME